MEIGSFAKLLAFKREARKAIVLSTVREAFSGWIQPKPRNFSRYSSQTDELLKLEGYTRASEIPDDCLKAVYPQFLSREGWLWLLPSLLLCCENKVSFGKHPVSLGLPPQTKPGDIEVISKMEVTTLFNSSQRFSLALYTEMWHWLSEDESHSHWKAFWHKYANLGLISTPD